MLNCKENRARDEWLIACTIARAVLFLIRNMRCGWRIADESAIRHLILLRECLARKYPSYHTFLLIRTQYLIDKVRLSPYRVATLSCTRYLCDKDISGANGWLVHLLQPMSSRPDGRQCTGDTVGHDHPNDRIP